MRTKWVVPGRHLLMTQLLSLLDNFTSLCCKICQIKIEKMSNKGEINSLFNVLSAFIYIKGKHYETSLNILAKVIYYKVFF